MRIRSDFRQPYDHFVDPAMRGEMPRFMRMGPSRRRQFELLGQAGFKTVEWGNAGQLESWTPFVIYDDWGAHCGEGKRLCMRNSFRSNPHMGMPGGDRFHDERLKLASRFYEHDHTIRLLRVGWHTFTIRYDRGDDSWRTNVNPAKVTTIDHKFEGNWSTHWLFAWPIWSVDLVEGRACDLNVSPGMPDDLPMTWAEIGDHVSEVWGTLGADPKVPE